MNYYSKVLIDSIILKRRENRFLLSDNQVAVLNKFNINYLNYSDMNEMLFDIENYLNSNYDYELDEISKQLSEIIYYSKFNK